MKCKRTRPFKRKTRLTAYFESVDSLPSKGFMRHTVVIPFYHNKVMMLNSVGNKLKLPQCLIEEGEYLYKTLRRRLHKDAGAVLQYSFLVGQFSVYDCAGDSYYVPVYVGKISHLEKKVSEEVKFLDVNKAVKQFAPRWEKPNLDYFINVLAKCSSRMRQDKKQSRQKSITKKKKNK